MTKQPKKKLRIKNTEVKLVEKIMEMKAQKHVHKAIGMKMGSEKQLVTEKEFHNIYQC